VLKAGKIQMVKYAPPPPELPVYGKEDSNYVSYIGRTNYTAALEEKKFVFGIKRADRRRHLYVVGKSGAGKSKFFELLIRQDISAGYGLCLIDPDGDLSGNILDFIPAERADDVCFIDLSDTKHSIFFNPFSGVEPDYRHQFAESFVEILKKQFGPDWVPKMEYVFRFACLALLDYPQATMQGLISILTNQEYRERVAGYVKDETAKNFWLTEFLEWSRKNDPDTVISIVNKLSQFLSHPVLKNIFSREENKVNVEELVNNNKIILVNLSKGRLGANVANFFGLVMIAKIKQVGMARVAKSKIERRDFYLYVDEFNGLMTETFESLLSDSRKYGICLTLANQYLGQLTPAVQAAVLGNVGTIVVFRVSGEDAERLEADMTPVFKAKDMINLSTQEFYVKMMIDGETYDPFSAETLKILPAPYESAKGRIMESSRNKYSAF
jgi:type IV secretory pathway TraG/TraD family ATPase VirD4